MDNNSIRTAYLILTENCNLRCTYCFENNSRKVSKRMSVETAHKAVDFLVSEAIKNNTDYFQVTFFGGEPTLCPDLMLEIMQYAEREAEKHKLKTKYSLITNGTIYNEKLESVFEYWYKLKGEINVQLSIDGIPEIQNINRPCANSCLKSSELVKETVKKYKDFYLKHNIDSDKLHIHACVSKKSLPYIYKSFMYFTRELGIKNVKFAWVQEDNWEDSDLIIFTEQLKLITSNLCKSTTNIKRFPFKHFDECSGCSCGKKVICIDTEGNIYPCHRFYFYVKDDRDKLIVGNVYNEVPVDNEKMKVYREFDISKCCSEPNQMCIALNYVTTGNLYQQPNEYPLKFIKIVNDYYFLYNEHIEKALVSRALKELGDRVERLENILQNRGE